MGIIAREIASQAGREASVARRKARETLRQKSRTELARHVRTFGWVRDGLGQNFPVWLPWVATFMHVGLLVLFVTVGVRETARIAIAAGVPVQTVVGCALVARRFQFSCAVGSRRLLKP